MDSVISVCLTRSLYVLKFILEGELDYVIYVMPMLTTHLYEWNSKSSLKFIYKIETYAEKKM